MEADRTGAAGLAVDCRLSKSGGADADRYADSPRRSPLAALKRGLGDDIVPWGNEHLRVAKRDEQRVMYTASVDGVIKFAAVVSDRPNAVGDTGWYGETTAMCDWAELPPAAAESRGIQVWSNAKDERVDTTKIHSQSGPAHCDEQNLTFLDIDRGDLEGGMTYHGGDVSDWPDFFDQPYVKALALPADAIDSGYHLGDRHLWFSADRKLAYVGNEDSVEQWPSPTQMFACA